MMVKGSLEKQYVASSVIPFFFGGGGEGVVLLYFLINITNNTGFIKGGFIICASEKK